MKCTMSYAIITPANGEVQGNVRAVFAAWDGGVDQASYAQMQQGLVVNLDFGDKTEDNPVLRGSSTSADANSRRSSASHTHIGSSRFEIDRKKCNQI